MYKKKLCNICRTFKTHWCIFSSTNHGFYTARDDWMFFQSVFHCFNSTGCTRVTRRSKNQQIAYRLGSFPFRLFVFLFVSISCGDRRRRRGRGIMCEIAIRRGVCVHIYRSARTNLNRGRVQPSIVVDYLGKRSDLGRFGVQWNAPPAAHFYYRFAKPTSPFAGLRTKKKIIPKLYTYTVHILRYVAKEGSVESVFPPNRHFLIFCQNIR